MRQARATGNAAHRIPAPCLRESVPAPVWLQSATTLPHKRYLLSQVFPERRLFWPLRLLSFLHEAPSVVPTDSPLSTTTSGRAHATDHSQTVYLAAAKLNDLHDGRCDIPPIDGCKKVSRGHHAPGFGRVRAEVTSDLMTFQEACAVLVRKTRTLEFLCCSFDGSDDGSNAMAAARQQVALVGLGMGVGEFDLRPCSSALAETPNGFNMASGKTSRDNCDN
ncbi:hypothetical protein H4582DRAFT_2078272 [Lactarius indigo]|nr:hypothetical protein H4582DRAFT_2078272 [Lactarius indigo]